MNYVCFGRPPWDPLVTNRLLALLPAGGECFRIVEQDQTDRPGPCMDERTLPVSALMDMDPKQTVALVFHPFWIRPINQFQPKHLIALISIAETEEDRPLLKKYWSYIAAQATLVCTDSERVYLEQCFRRDAVFFLHNESEPSYDIHAVKGDTLLLNDSEVLFRDAVATMFQERSICELVERQWRQRIEYYQKKTDNTATLDAAFVALAVYYYLLGQTDHAREFLLKSLEQSPSGSGQTACPISPHRLLSTIEAKSGHLEQAVSTYGRTAVDPDEKASHLHLQELLAAGKRDEVQANLFLLGEDYKSAASLFSRLSTESARSGLIQSYVRMNQLEQALQLATSCPPRSPQDRRDRFLLKGTVEAIKANRHEAINAFLQAATCDYEAIAPILEMRAVDERIAAFTRGKKA